jgi:putative endonuclease
MAQHNLLGKQGENFAAAFLIQNGYLILERGWTYRHLELDIIAFKDNLLVVVEVKTRATASYADPDDTISNAKLRKIYDATEHYMELKNIPWEVRYDLITVIASGDPWGIEHLEGAFYPFMSI